METVHWSLTHNISLTTHRLWLHLVLLSDPPPPNLQIASSFVRSAVIIRISFTYVIFSVSGLCQKLIYSIPFRATLTTDGCHDKVIARLSQLRIIGLDNLSFLLFLLYLYFQYSYQLTPTIVCSPNATAILHKRFSFYEVLRNDSHK